jgi:hypothetical protein
VRIARERNAGKVREVVSEDILRLKKRIFEEITTALKGSNRTLRDLFAKIDTDNGGYISASELHSMF